VHQDFEGDVFFPEIKPEEWDLLSAENITDDPQNDFSYTFEIYKRK
jgi:dihydrofolate reductase